jgi:hypothetical protein
MEVAAEMPEALQAQFDFIASHDPVELDVEELEMDDAGIAEVMQHDDIDARMDQLECVYEDRLWIDDGWTARVIKNEDDDGWAVAMIKDGESEPALVGPWTMGRDKKNPKPLDAAAFNTLVKTASEVLRRHEQQLHAMLHKSVSLNTRTATLTVTLDITPDEHEPYGVLTAMDDDGVQLAQVRVAANFKFTRESAQAWVDGDFRKPR